MKLYMANPPTKSELEKLYFNKTMSIPDIAKHYGYYDRQPIHKLFKKFGIKTRSTTEVAKVRLATKHIIPNKETVLTILGNKSINEAAKFANMSRSKLTRWLEHYNIKPEFFIGPDTKQQLRDESLTFKEAALKYDVSVTTVKYYRKAQSPRTYDTKAIKKKLNEYYEDLNNLHRGASEQIRLDDPCLYESIMRETKDHILTTNKFTERIYRIMNDYNKTRTHPCKFCFEPLKFYTYGMGYGNSNISVCKTCTPKHSGFGVSQSSQRMFWLIYEKLTNDKKARCNFSDLNHELVILTKGKTDAIQPKNRDLLNKHKYHVDFSVDNKIIEFDGTYWHKKTKEKDLVRDEFLRSLGYKVLRIKEVEFTKNKEKTIKECIEFLNQ